MKPKDLITKSIEETLVEPLAEIGFSFSKNTLSFDRKVNEFVQIISFHCCKYNQENECAEFWTSFGVLSKKYSKWYQAEFNENPVNDLLGNSVDWNIKDWGFPILNGQRELHFQITDEKERRNSN